MANLSSSRCFAPLQLGQERNLGCLSTRSISSPDSNTSHHREKGQQDVPPILCHLFQPLWPIREAGITGVFGEAAMGAHSSSQGFLEGRGGISLC